MSSRSRSPRTPLAVLGVAAATLLLAACGSSGHPSIASSEKSNEQRLLAFTRCLREHGVNVEKSPGGGIAFRGTRANPQAMEAATSACKRYAPNGGRANLSPAERVAREEAVRKFAKCMREHGIHLEAETRDGGAGVVIKAHAGAGAPNPESAGFQAAQNACQGLLPKPPGGLKRTRVGPPGTSTGGGPPSGGSGSGPQLGLQAGG